MLGVCDGLFHISQKTSEKSCEQVTIRFTFHILQTAVQVLRMKESA